jgi:cyclophilin family peptidyl-prolyl cis-trans isomerase
VLELELVEYVERVQRRIDTRACLREDRRPRGSRRAAALLITAVALALAVAACGSSSSGTGTVQGIGTKSVKGSEYTGTATGSSGSETTANTSGTERRSSSTAGSGSAATGGQQSAPSSIHVAGCRSVPAPASRVGEQASKPTTQLDPARSYTVRLVTNCGTIVIQLAVKEAPKTTSSFAHLVKLGYYNGLTFHRVVTEFVIQGGDPNGNGTGGPSWGIVEPPPATLRYTKGVVGMAKSASAPSGASGSQFFVVTGSTVGLPPVYALVGRVVGGEPAVEAISHVPTERETPRAPMVIERATLSVR